MSCNITAGLGGTQGTRMAFGDWLLGWQVASEPPTCSLGNTRPQNNPFSCFSLQFPHVLHQLSI